MNTRIRCNLFGCRLDDYGTCQRCDVFIYDYPGIIETGLLQAFASRLRPVWDFIRGQKCDVCGARFRKGSSPFCCSEECDSKWTPF